MSPAELMPVYTTFAIVLLDGVQANAGSRVQLREDLRAGIDIARRGDLDKAVGGSGGEHQGIVVDIEAQAVEAIGAVDVGRGLGEQGRPVGLF